MKTAPLLTFVLESIYAKTDRVECLRLIVQNWSVRSLLPTVVAMACVCTMSGNVPSRSNLCLQPVVNSYAPIIPL